MALVWDPIRQEYVDDGDSHGGPGGGGPGGGSGGSGGGSGSDGRSLAELTGTPVDGRESGFYGPWAPGFGQDQLNQSNFGVPDHLQQGWMTPPGDNPPRHSWNRFTGRWEANEGSEYPGGGGGGYDFWGGIPNRPDYEPLPEFSFQAPTEADLYNDPSYKSRRDEGRQVLEQSASGKGILRTGGTLKDIIGYGQNFASREYGNVYDRRFQEAKARYEPVVLNWQGRNRVSELEFNRIYDKAMAQLDDDFRYVTLGVGV